MNMQSSNSKQMDKSWKKLSPITLMASKVFVAALLKEDAEMYLKKRKFAIARRRIEQARFNSLPMEDYHDFMADVCTLQNDSLSAIKHLKKGIHFHKKSDKHEEVAASHLTIAKIYKDLGNNRQSKYHAERAYKNYQTREDINHNWLLLNNIAIQLSNNGDKKTAIGIYRRVYLSTQNSIIRGNLIATLIDDEQYDEALEIADDIPLSQLSDYNESIKIACKKTGNTERLKQHMKSMREFYRGEVADTLSDYRDVKIKDPEISINGLTIDLKQLNDGSIRLLEMNFLPASGLNGYNVHHKHTLQHVINSGYEYLTEILDEQGYYDRKTDNYLQNRFQGMGSATTFSNWMVMLHADRPVLFNASLNALMAQHYKDEFALSVQGLGLQEFIPETVVASRYEQKSDILQRAKNIQSDQVLIKTSNDARGEGVEVIPANRLPNVVDTILNGGAWHGCENPKAWTEDFHPNFLIQECVQSKPCRAVDGEQYDATMRVALTHIFNHQTDENTLLIHGMFWKLPKKPISSGSKRDMIVSLAKNQDIIKGRPHSARVSPPRQAQVQKQLEHFFQTYGAHMASPNSGVIESKTHIAKIASSRPIGFLATEQLTSHPYGNLMLLLNKDNPNAMHSIFDFSAKIQNPHMESIKRTWLNHRHNQPLSMKEAGLMYSRTRTI